MIISLKQLAKLKVLNYIFFAETDISIDELGRELKIRKPYLERILKEFILKGYVAQNPFKKFSATEEVENLTLYDFLDFGNYLYDLEYLFGEKTIHDTVIEESLKELIGNIKSESTKIKISELKSEYNRINSEMFYL